MNTQNKNPQNRNTNENLDRDSQVERGDKARLRDQEPSSSNARRDEQSTRTPRQ